MLDFPIARSDRAPKRAPKKISLAQLVLLGGTVKLTAQTRPRWVTRPLLNNDRTVCHERQPVMATRCGPRHPEYRSDLLFQTLEAKRVSYMLRELESAHYAHFGCFGPAVTNHPLDAG
jgi:hypothetical protein